jgi:hypothetical protein
MGNFLETIISGIIKERFPAAAIEAVTVETGTDSDGEPVLRIRIVIDADIGKLEPHRLAGLARHIRSKLSEYQERAFPIIRTISKQDNECLKREAA